MSNGDSFAIDFNDDDEDSLGFVRNGGPLIDPPLIRVYLAGPLTNNDEGANLECQRIRQVVKDLLHGYDFLGVEFLVYDPADVTPPGTDHSPEEVYSTDFQSTAGAELVVFHVNVPSLGVGMESQISAFATVPRVIICKSGSPVSRMFRGVFAPTLAKIEYENTDDARRHLEAEIPTIAAAAIESAEKRRPITEDLSALELGKRILKQRILSGMTVQELAVETDIREFWILRLEREPGFFATCSFIQFLRICHALKCYASLAMDGRRVNFSSEGEGQLSADQKISLENLAIFVRSREHRVSDDKIIRLWREYVEQREEQQQEAGQLRAAEEPVVSVDEWRRRYDDLGLF